RGRKGPAAQGRRRHYLRLGSRRRIGQPGRRDQPAPAALQDRTRHRGPRGSTGGRRRRFTWEGRRMSRFAFRGAAATAPLPPPAPTPETPEAAPAPPTLSFNIEPAPPPAPPSSTDNALLDMRLKLHARLIEEIDLSKLDKLEEAEMRRQVRKLTADFARAER